MLVYICAELVHSKMQDVFDMVYSLLVFVNIRVILYKTYVVLICGKYNTLTLEFKINIAIRVPLHMAEKNSFAVSARTNRKRNICDEGILTRLISSAPHSSAIDEDLFSAFSLTTCAWSNLVPITSIGVCVPANCSGS